MAGDGEIERTVNRGLAWMGLASGVVGAFDLISTVVVLAFFLSPAEYGVAMLAGSLFAVLDLATDLGLSAAVIQRDDHTEARISTVFWLNVALSLVILGALAVLAPLLGALQGEALVGTILVAYGGKLVFQNVYFIPQAMMKKQLRFAELSLIRIAANTAEFAAKITAAALGAGVWFHIIGRACHTLVTAIGIQLRHPWRPRMVIRVGESRAYLGFGLKASASQILFHLYTNLDYQVVGYYFGAAANGFYHLAYTLVLEPVRMVSHVVFDVAFPTFARLRHDRPRLMAQFIAFTRLNLVTVTPIMVGLLIASGDLIELFWGPTWAPAAEAAQILCWVGVLRALAYVAPPLLDGMGKPTLTLVYMVTASVVSTASFIVSAEVFGDELGFTAVAWAWVAGYPLAFAVLFWIALSELELPVAAFARRVMGVPLCVAGAGAVAYGAHWALGGAAVWLRFAVVVAIVLGGTAVLLAWFQGISPRTIKASLRAK